MSQQGSADPEKASSEKTCFVIMPYGMKKDIDGKEIDFEEIYHYVIKPAVESLEGFICLRCDDIEAPGWVHERMLTHIYEDPIAIVDTSTLNANVFYELGVRHALKKSVTVLIHNEGTTWPFNIAGLNSIKYSTGPRGVDEAKKKIATFIVNGLNDPQHTDSLVYNVLPDLQVGKSSARVARRLTQVRVWEYPLARDTQSCIGLVSGDRENLAIGDIWASSENTDMQMDRFYGTSTSATIRYLGAKKHPITGRVIEDTIGDELATQLGDEKQVAPTAVIVTGPGELRRNNNVKWIFHVAAVTGEPREGYRSIERIERCVTAAFRRAASVEVRDDPPTSILFPVFGTGPGGGHLHDHAERCIDAAVECLESGLGGSVRKAYFYAWSDVAWEIIEGIMERHRSLQGARKIGSDSAGEYNAG
jgi:O-acetyl-ADP-ribose deacetylase (regulator of RNase III)